MDQATLVRHAVKESPDGGLTSSPDGTLRQASAPPDPRVGEETRDPTTGGGAAQIELSTEEIELLAEIATGVTTDVAARRLELSARTLRRRLRTVCDRLDVNTPIEAVVWAARRQLI
ncbi:LuxR C-terminal-related transcriptional regulator [Lipingzhangella sp. LS1_29]|uniref:LuxR C-terminal-related transcriptional regulator n=1 Tax=Lipingzhangella rawalii TaxID=2055835 RepID=A0ABU2HAN6_9ACTN|nr:LuxR C-terminal-related transcriptional regulator [Lipingzhangella rawalii]MDS1271929.1 LuxR C-terminal-related transcriptional regulator [Lipingzhangella rawalii]